MACPSFSHRPNPNGERGGSNALSRMKSRRQAVRLTSLQVVVRLVVISTLRVKTRKCGWSIYHDTETFVLIIQVLSRFARNSRRALVWCCVHNLAMVTRPLLVTAAQKLCFLSSFVQWQNITFSFARSPDSSARSMLAHVPASKFACCRAVLCLGVGAGARCGLLQDPR